MIINFGKTSFYIGPLLDVSPFGREQNVFIPKFFYFDGGCYFKFGFYFLGQIFEFCRPKKDNRIPKKVTKEELDKILLELDDYAN